MTFREWLEGPGRDAFSRLAWYVEGDECFPDAHDLEQLQIHLASHTAGRAAVRDLDEAYAAFLDYMEIS